MDCLQESQVQFFSADAVSPKPAKIRKSESRSHDKKPFQIGASFPGHSPFNFGHPIRPIPPPPQQPSSGHGPSFLEPGFDSLPDPRNNDSNAFAPEKMAFAAAAAAVAAANSNNAKGKCSNTQQEKFSFFGERWRQNRTEG